MRVPTGDGRAVVVTGVSSGIGRATAVHLADLGFDVFGTVRRPEDLDDLARVHPKRLHGLLLDVTDPAGIRSAAGKVAEWVGPAGLYGLVNNAGIGVAGPIECLPLEDLRRQLEVNIIGTVAALQAFLPQIRMARGRVINIGSMAGRLAIPLLGAYAASKGALRSLTDALRLELGAWGIRVCLVEPGSIATPIYERVRAQADALVARLPPEARDLYGPHEAAVRRATEEWLSRRASPPEGVARVIGRALLARRPRARYLVGAGARVQALLAATFPDGMRDAVLVQALGLPRWASVAPPRPRANAFSRPRS